MFASTVVSMVAQNFSNFISQFLKFLVFVHYYTNFKSFTFFAVDIFRQYLLPGVVGEGSIKQS